MAARNQVLPRPIEQSGSKGRMEVFNASCQNARVFGLEMVILLQRRGVIYFSASFDEAAMSTGFINLDENG